MSPESGKSDGKIGLLTETSAKSLKNRRGSIIQLLRLNM